ncbi:MAG: DUF1176 domain-containing protein [Rhizobiaceae bacterium]|nr:DUF1176 domain-containing protein [Rhizobiaceae bacterium]
MIRISSPTLAKASCIAALAALAAPSAAAQQAAPDTVPAIGENAQSVEAPPELLMQAKAAAGPLCTFEVPEGSGYQSWPIVTKLDGDAADQAARTFTLHEFFCMAGAYNIVTVYLMTDDYGETSLVSFAEPSFRAVYQDDDFEKAVLRIDVEGFTAVNRLVNAYFDPQTAEMTSFSKWRGIGDASSSGRYRFIDGQFALVHFEVDASYDDEINPTVIYDAAPETP